MHLLYVTTTYPPENGWGGIGTYVYHIAKGMVALGNQVTVLCGVGERGAHEAVIDGIRVVRRIPIDASDEAVSAEVARVLPRIIDNHGVEVIEFPEYGAWGSDFQRDNPGFPTVVRLHGGSFHLCSWQPFPIRAARWLLNHRLYKFDAAERESARRAHALTSCSRWLLETNLRRGWTMPSVVEVVANPLPAPAMSAPAAVTSAPATSVAWLGRLDRLKGADLLPEIAKRVWQDAPDVMFNVFGQDQGMRSGRSWASWIKEQLPRVQREKILFHGGVAHADVPRRVSECSIAVFASMVENFPYSHIECMQCGLACVVASGGGAREVGQDGAHMVFARRTPSFIGKAVSALISDGERRHAIGIAAREHVATSFEASIIAAQSSTIYQRAITSARGQN